MAVLASTALAKNTIDGIADLVNALGADWLLQVRVSRRAETDDLRQPRIETGVSEPEFEFEPSPLSPEFTDAQVLLTELDAETVRTAFDRLFTQRSSRAEQLFDEVAQRTNPQTLLRIALEEFETKGNQDRLQMCARALAAMGRRAATTFVAIANSSLEEQSAFVDAIVLAEFFSISERRDLMAKLARSSVEDTRWRLLDVVDCLPLEYQDEILRILETDQIADLAEQANAERVDLGTSD